MINFADIRTALFTGINTDTGVLTIEANQATHKPPYPYTTILFGGPIAGGQAHKGNIYIIDNEEDDTIDYTIAKNEVLTLSVTAIAGDSLTAQTNALKAADWFSWTGQETLKDAGASVLTVMPLTNRDSIIVDQWERRVGFDVRLQVLDVTVKTMERIDQIERTKKDGSKEMI